MKFRTKILLGLGIAGIGATAYLSPERAWNEAQNVAENAYHETKEFADDLFGKKEKVEISLDVQGENVSDITDKFLSVEKGQDVFFNVRVPGKDLQYFKVTMDDNLIARAEMNKTKKGRVFMTQNNGRTKFKQFPKYFTDLDITYAGNFNVGNLEAGRHTVKLWIKDTNGQEYTDEAFIRLR